MASISDQFWGSVPPESENPSPSTVGQNATQPTQSTLFSILTVMPLSEFRRLGVVPVSYSEGDKRLKLVCSASVDETLRYELSSRLPGVEFEWYHADDRVISVMLQRLENIVSAHSPVTTNPPPPDTLAEPEVVSSQPDTSVPESHAPIPVISPVRQEVDATCRQTTTTPAEASAKSVPQPGAKEVLFVTPAGKVSPHIQFALHAERYAAVTVCNQDQAVIALAKHNINAVFIHEHLVGRCEQLITRLQTETPEMPLRYFGSEAAILLNDTRNPAMFDLVRQNLSLFGRLISRQSSEFANHASNVSRLADRMMVRMGISDQWRLMVTTAAYLHNIAEENLTSLDGLQQADIIRLSASKLESWGYPTSILRLLRRMHHGIGEADGPSEGNEATGASILTAADMFSHMWPDCSNVGRQLEVVQRKIEDQLQWKVMPSIISTLIDVICDDCTARMLRPNTFRIHLFTARGERPSALIDALRNAEYGITDSTTVLECAQHCRSAKAEMLIIADSGSVEDLYDTLIGLSLRGVAIDQLHTMLLIDETRVSEALRLLSHGVEEILPNTAQPEAMITKLTRTRNRVEEQYRHQVSAVERLGTHGSLGDLCLTDILEIWRGNRRPARISVTAFGNQLTVYLDHGKVVAAECGECEGIAALLRGVSWRQGVWNIDSIEQSELPEPNVDQSIDAVLIEACSRLDEVTRNEPSCAKPVGAR